MEDDSLFLSLEDIHKLTGFRRHSRQAEQLKAMGIAFHLNARGCPVVPKVAAEGRKRREAAPKAWAPAVLGGR